jgi:hypothetical protein
MPPKYISSVAAFILALSLLVPPRYLAAQGTSWSDSIGCAETPDTASLRLTLPLDVLNHLERMSSSVFVHAFLIRYISDPAAGEHRLARCARAFVGAQLTDFRTLRRNLPDAAAIIDALRTAEQARLRTAQLADSTQLVTVVAQLGTDASGANLEALGEPLTAATRFCGSSRAGACGILLNVVDQLETVRRARGALQAAGEQARQAAAEAAQVADEKLSAEAGLAADTIRLAQLAGTVMAADTAARRELELRIRRWSTVVDSLAAARQPVVDNVGRAEQARQQAATTADEAQRRLSGLLARLESELRRAGENLGTHTVEALQGSRIGAAVATSIAEPPVQAAAANPSRSVNVLLELTDFIIERMKREAVNSFIVNLHALAEKEPLLRDGFPETWGLMQGLSTLSDGRLNALDVGRIPLTTWRATMAGDFVKLPVNLLESGPVALCRSGEAADSGAWERARKNLEACRQRVAMLKPLVPAATRLLEGDAVFDVLRDANSFAPPQGPDLPAEWRRVSQGLSIVAALSETYLVQGYSPAADPSRHPYLLTARSLAQVPQGQRDAFARLLLVRAIPSQADVPGTTTPATLQSAVSGATLLLERIASRQSAPEPTPANASLVLRGAFDALVSATDLARVLAPGDTSTWLDGVRTRWRAVSGTLESIEARDFGLTLARTTMLLRDLRGVDVPGPVLTFTALASSLSEARDGGQVRAAFEAAASPVGGWQAKRYGAGGASINAFPGLAFGFERAIRENGDPADADETATTLGAALPIGVELQLRLSRAAGTSSFDCTIVCGVGVFIPVIDVGALLSYRVKGPDSVESEPNATVRQVFAPGAYLSLALTRTVPLNLLAGAQFMPGLRSVDAPEGTVRRSAVRYGVGIGMDIVLFKF